MDSVFEFTLGSIIMKWFWMTFLGKSIAYTYTSFWIKIFAVFPSWSKSWKSLLIESSNSFLWLLTRYILLLLPTQNRPVVSWASLQQSHVKVASCESDELRQACALDRRTFLNFKDHHVKEAPVFSSQAPPFLS